MGIHTRLHFIAAQPVADEPADERFTTPLMARLRELALMGTFMPSFKANRNGRSIALFK